MAQRTTKQQLAASRKRLEAYIRFQSQLSIHPLADGYKYNHSGEIVAVPRPSRGRQRRSVALGESINPKSAGMETRRLLNRFENPLDYAGSDGLIRRRKYLTG